MCVYEYVCVCLCLCMPVCVCVCMSTYVLTRFSTPQRSIRPQVVTTFQLEGCHDMWTVCGPPASEEKEEEEEKKEGEEGEGEKEEDAGPSITNGHAYLVLSRSDSSMVSWSFSRSDSSMVSWSFSRSN